MTTTETKRVDAVLGELATTLTGTLVRAGDDDYDDARSVWNGMIDARPVAVARCASTKDVQAVVRAARETGLPLAVRGGGHNVAGFGTVDDGIVIDLSPLHEVTVDAATRRVRVGGGATLGQLDAATQEHGLAVPAGVVSETGIAGLTLSGGAGWLRRKHGLSCDNMVAAELVTATGDVIRVDESTDPELLWGLRGGGGNFGVVTEFTFQGHALGPEVAFVYTLYPLDVAHAVLAEHERIVHEAGDGVSTIVALGHVPPLDDLPAEIHELPFVAVLAMYAGAAGAGEEVLRPLRELAEPIVDLSGRMPYVDAQRVLDADFPAGHRYYWKATWADELSPGLVDLLVEHTGRAPSKHSTVDLWLHGGAVASPGNGASAFGGRSALYGVTAEANWEHPEDDAANVAWARELLAAAEPYSSGGAYLNFPGLLEEGQALVRASFGSNYERLAALKARVDPENLFRRNANVLPSPAS